MSDVYAKLQALQITLPPLAAPAAAYVPYVQTGKLLFISGHLAKKEGKPWVGQLGKDMDTATGQQAARAAASSSTRAAPDFPLARITAYCICCPAQAIMAACAA